MQEQVEAALANMAATLESSSASNILADFTQLAAMIRQEVRHAHATHVPLCARVSCGMRATNDTRRCSLEPHMLGTSSA